MPVEKVTVSPIIAKPTDDEKSQNGLVTATGIGAGVTSSVGRSKMRKVALERPFKEALKNTESAVRQINRNSSVFERIAQAFKINYANCSKFITTKLEAFKNVKYIAPIIKSPIMKKGVALSSGLFAFFVAISSIKDAVNNGEVAIDSIKNLYA